METITYSQVQKLVKRVPVAKLPFAYSLLVDLADKEADELSPQLTHNNSKIPSLRYSLLVLKTKINSTRIKNLCIKPNISFFGIRREIRRCFLLVIKIIMTCYYFDNEPRNKTILIIL